MFSLTQKNICRHNPTGGDVIVSASAAHVNSFGIAHRRKARFMKKQFAKEGLATQLDRLHQENKPNTDGSVNKEIHKQAAILGATLDMWKKLQGAKLKDVFIGWKKEVKRIIRNRKSKLASYGDKKKHFIV